MNILKAINTAMVIFIVVFCFVFGTGTLFFPSNGLDNPVRCHDVTIIVHDTVYLDQFPNHSQIK